MKTSNSPPVKNSSYTTSSIPQKIAKVAIALTATAASVALFANFIFYALKLEIKGNDAQRLFVSTPLSFRSFCKVAKDMNIVAVQALCLSAITAVAGFGILAAVTILYPKTNTTNMNTKKTETDPEKTQ
jgi:hypothetical protein